MGLDSIRVPRELGSSEILAWIGSGPSSIRGANVRSGSNSATSTSDSSSLPPGARWTSRNLVPTPIGPGRSGARRDGVGLPRGELRRVGDVGKHLARGAGNLGLDGEGEQAGETVFTEIDALV